MPAPFPISLGRSGLRTARLHAVDVVLFLQSLEPKYGSGRIYPKTAVGRSGYYEWRRREPCARQQEDVKLLAAIEQTHRASRRAYGAEKTWRALNASGVACGKHRVARVRCQAGIEALRKQRFRRLENTRYSGRHREPPGEAVHGALPQQSVGGAISQWYRRE
ncbi:IS3 family transposase [Achromobacter pestifer]|uniref:IS3 family transposase n=1 Tax=Achromobacter pestifer TaxID=1353889 RepID=UPI003CCE4736